MSADGRDPGTAAAEKRAHLAAMFEHAPPHFSVEPERFSLVTYNEAFARHVREAYGIELCPGMTPDEMLEPARASRWRELLARALREGSFRTDYVTAAGDVHMLLTLNRLEHAGAVIGVSVLAVDVTESRRALKQLAEAEVRLAALVESTDDLIWSVDPESFGLVTFNRALAEYFRTGRTQLEIRAGMTPEDLLPGPGAERWAEFYRRALGEGSCVVEYETASHGKTLLLSVNRMEREGRVFGISVFGKDVTERQRVQRALAESENRFRALIEDSPVAIGVSSGESRIEYVNRTYAKTFRTTPEALVGLPVIGQWAPESRSQLQQLMQRMQTEAGGVEFESLGLRADGSVFPVHAAVAVLRRETSPIGVVFLTDISERKAVEAKLQETLAELSALKDRLQQDNVALRQQITVHHGATATIIGRSPAIARVTEQARTVAPTDSAVLVTGETGTGKELLARAIHEMSPRRGRQMVTVNCAALPAGLIESELFGREKGAYTGAWTRQQGRFEAADGSTLFLDEVAELPPETQAKLLRVLQDGRFERLGSTQSITVNVRVIAATNRELIRMVEAGQFRADLFYRLGVFPIEMPPLRSRPEDVPLLVWDAVRFFGLKLGKTIDTIPSETMQRLQQHAWPGNVRELRNLVERSVILSSGRTLSVALESEAEGSLRPPVTLAEAERQHVLATLERTGWRIGGKDGAAALLGLQRSTLNSLMKRLGISRPKS